MKTKKRRVPRRAFYGHVGALISGKYFLTEASEIGEGGMMLFMDEAAMNVGKEIVLNFKISATDYLIIRGVIRYRQDPETPSGRTSYGVQFSNVDLKGLRLIRSYVATTSDVGPSGG